MSNQPQNNKEGTAVLGSLVFMALYALGIWHNAVEEISLSSFFGVFYYLLMSAI